MSIKNIIKSYTPVTKEEEIEKQSFLQFLDNFDEDFCGQRSNLVGHLTSSAWVVNKSRDSVVMAHHNIYKSWSWLGGHADGDKDLLYVAKKEVEEESGLSKILALSETPIDVAVINVNPHIKRNKLVPAHLHFNVTYLFEANEDDSLIHRPEENSGVKWVKNSEVLTESSEDCMKEIYTRIMRKAELF